MDDREADDRPPDPDDDGDTWEAGNEAECPDPDAHRWGLGPGSDEATD